MSLENPNKKLRTSAEVAIRVLSVMVTGLYPPKNKLYGTLCALTGAPVNSPLVQISPLRQ